MFRSELDISSFLLCEVISHLLRCLTVRAESGENIPLSPWTRVVFEAAELSRVSPATVSRCGLIFVRHASTSQIENIKCLNGERPQ